MVSKGLEVSQLRRAWVWLLATVVLIGGVGSAAAELRIDITQGTVEPLLIAVPNLVGATDAQARYGQDIANVIAADPERSGLFQPIDPKSFIQSEATMQTLQIGRAHL